MSKMGTCRDRYERCEEIFLSRKRSLESWGLDPVTVAYLSAWKPGICKITSANGDSLLARPGEASTQVLEIEEYSLGVS